jgi:hypothetical protein
MRSRAGYSSKLARFNVSVWANINAAGGSIEERTEAFLRALAPRDLDGQPLYVVLRSQIDDDRVDCLNGCRAYTGFATDLHLQSWLERAGRWRGRGPAMLIYDQKFCCETSMQATAIHELAHILERELNAFNTVPLEEWPADSRHYLSLDYSAQNPQDCRPSSEPAWYQHGAEFIRVGIHLTFRAYAAGFPIGAAMPLIAGEAYGLSPIHDYAEALLSEMEGFPQPPLRSLANRPPPRAFAELFERDTAPECRPLAGPADALSAGFESFENAPALPVA